MGEEERARGDATARKAHPMVARLASRQRNPEIWAASDEIREAARALVEVIVRHQGGGVAETPACATALRFVENAVMKAEEMLDLPPQVTHP
jgi:acyl-CoA reductase-like NAD-dependent aldehyde dehydrogenase